MATWTKFVWLPAKYKRGGAGKKFLTPWITFHKVSAQCAIRIYTKAGKPTKNIRKGRPYATSPSFERIDGWHVRDAVYHMNNLLPRTANNFCDRHSQSGSPINLFLHYFEPAGKSRNKKKTCQGEITLFFCYYHYTAVPHHALIRLTVESGWGDDTNVWIRNSQSLSAIIALLLYSITMIICSVQFDSIHWIKEKVGVCAQKK